MIVIVVTGFFVFKSDDSKKISHSYSYILFSPNNAMAKNLFGNASLPP